MKFRHASLQLLSVLTLVLLGWSFYITVQRPTIGVFWGYRSGVIYEIDSSHPSAKILKIGDRIINGDGLNPTELYNFSGKTPGDLIRLEINRNGQDYSFWVEVTKSDFMAIAERLIPLLIAVGFWISGNTVLAFSRTGLSPILFFLACQATTITLGTGVISSYSPDWVKVLLHIGFIWTGAFTVNLHFIFPVRHITQKTKFAGTVIVSVATIISLILIVSYSINLGILGDSFIWWVTLLMFGVDLVASIIFLIRAYKKAHNAKEHHQVGIIILSGIIGILPTIIFSIIPILIAGIPIIPAQFSLFALVLVPIGYGYAILRYRLIGVDKTINRGTTYSLVALFMGGIYTIMYAFSARFSPSLLNYGPIWVLVFAMLFAVLSNKLYRLFFNLVNRILYGGWYDYRSVVDNISNSLDALHPENESIGSVLCQTIGKSMRLDNTRLILSDGLIFIFMDNNPIQIRQVDTQNFKKLFDRILNIENDDIFLPCKENIEELNHPDFGIRDSQPQYLIPLKGKDKKILGIFILGRKQDGESLDEGDLEILRVVVYQAQVTLENALLLTEAQEHSDKVSRLHRQVLRAREEERKHVARDLHDLIIQSLVGVNYRMAEMRVDPKSLQDSTLVETQNEIRRVMTDLRQICADLRPPSLDVLGLSPAIRAKATEFEDGANFKVRVKIEGNEDQEITEEVKLCIYRLVQESLINAQKHSEADHVEIWMQITSEKIMVSITDNGIGFEVPDHFGGLTHGKHFGLVGLKEMVEAVSGIFQISSKPGLGCILSVEVPI